LEVLFTPEKDEKLGQVVKIKPTAPTL